MNQGDGHPALPADTPKVAESRRVVECVPWQAVRYRYLLYISFDLDRAGAPASGPILTVIQKNPSLADAARSDPTAGKVEAWACRHAFAAVIYVNLFALRSPDPHAVNSVPLAEAVGPENAAALGRACAAADVVVAAWGNPNGIHEVRYAARVAEVLDWLEREAYPLHRVGDLTRREYPRHGLRWHAGALLHRWR